MLTLQFISNSELRDYGEEKIENLLKLVKSNNIIVVEGGLNPEEEANMIKLTMSKINTRFRGIEIATIHPDNKKIPGLEKVKMNLAYMLLGRSQGFTVIGPANIVKEIKKDPNKIQLFTSNKKRKNASSMC